MAKKTNKTESHDHHDLPKKGDEFVCDICGMALVITKSCGCQVPAESTDHHDHVCLRCCGEDMNKCAAE